MNKLLFSLLSCVMLPVAGMEWVKPLHDRLTLEEIHQLKNADPGQSKGLLCCVTQVHPLVVRCKQEADILEARLGKEICKKLISEWSHDELKTFIPFLLAIEGKENLKQLHGLAEKKLNKDHLKWYDYIIKDLKDDTNTDFIKNSLALYGTGSFPKIKVGLGQTQMDIFDGSTYKKIALSRPEFIALFVAAKGDKLINYLSQ